MDLLRGSSDYSHELSEIDALYREIGRAITEWSYVEGALCDVLLATSDLPPILVQNRHFAMSASFFAVENFRSKLAMVDAACEMSLPAHNFGLPKANRTLVEDWKKLKNKVSKASQRRNFLAHYMILNDPERVGTSNREHYLTTSIYNPRLNRKIGTKDEKKLYLADIHNFTKRFKKLTKEIRDFSEITSYGAQQLRAYLAQHNDPLENAVQLPPSSIKPE